MAVPHMSGEWQTNCRGQGSAAAAGQPAAPVTSLSYRACGSDAEGELDFIAACATQ
jgi:hypothetical protein